MKKCIYANRDVRNVGFIMPIQNTAKIAAVTAAVENALAIDPAVSLKFTVPRLIISIRAMATIIQGIGQSRFKGEYNFRIFTHPEFGDYRNYYS